MLNMKSALLLQYIQVLVLMNHPKGNSTLCKMSARGNGELTCVRSQGAPGGGARYYTDTGVRPPHGGAQTKQRERRLQAETLRANTAQAALSKQSLANLHPPPGPGHGGGIVLAD